MKVREIIKLIEADGWYRIKAKGDIGNTSIQRSPGESQYRAR